MSEPRQDDGLTPQPAADPVTQNPETREPQRVAVLDGIRGLAAMLVLVMHATHTMHVHASPADLVFKKILGCGYIGVDLFFVLSGFLITGILLDHKGAPGYYRNFYMRRVLRIFPLYYGYLALVFFVLPAIGGFSAPHGWRDQLWYWLYMPNFKAAVDGSLPGYSLTVLWSLGIEEQFYLVWPWLVAVLPRTSLKKLVIFMIFAAAFARYITMGYNLPQEVKGVMAYVLPWTRMDALAFGALLAILKREPGGFASLHGWAILGFSASGAWMLAIFFQPEAYRYMYWGQMATTLNFTVFGVFFTSAIVLVSNAPPRAWSRRFFESPTLQMWGKYSYALYVFQLPVFAVLQRLGYTPEFHPTLGGSHLPAAVLFTIVMTVLTTGAAWISWHAYEMHFLKLKRMFAYGRGKS